MKRILFISTISFFTLPFTPWWTIWIILGLGGCIVTNYKEAIRIGIVSAFLAWGIKIGIGFVFGSSILIQRVGDMMGFSAPILLIFTTLLLAVFLGGISAMSGYHLRKMFQPPILG